jgi:acetylornithine deacetylase
LLQDLDDPAWPAMCVVGEPSGMQPVLAHKGKLNLRACVRGLTGHSSEPGKGVNVIRPPVGARLCRGGSTPTDAEGPFEDGFDPPHTTIHMSAPSRVAPLLNIIPERCEFIMEWRAIPGDLGDTPSRAHAPVRHGHHRAGDAAVNADTGFEFEVMTTMRAWRSTPIMRLPASSQLTGSNSAGR